MKQIDGQRLLEMVLIGVQVAGSQREFARQLGVSPQYLNDILQGYRPAGSSQKVLDWFKLEKVIFYRRIDGGSL
jgi:hypothetical protein